MGKVVRITLVGLSLVSALFATYLWYQSQQQLATATELSKVVTSLEAAVDAPPEKRLETLAEMRAGAIRAYKKILAERNDFDDRARKSIQDDIDFWALTADELGIDGVRAFELGIRPYGMEFTE